MNTPAASDKKPVLLVIVGPFGSGKNAVRDALLSTGEYVSCLTATTRLPRPDERNKVNYHFLKPVVFETLRNEGKFLEWAIVHGKYYGTLLKTVLRAFARGKNVILVIDIQGLAFLKDCSNQMIKNAIVSVYLEANLQTCIARATGRPGGMTDEEVRIRTASWMKEESQKFICDYRVPNPNGKFEEAVRTIFGILARHTNAM